MNKHLFPYWLKLFKAKNVTAVKIYWSITRFDDKFFEKKTSYLSSMFYYINNNRYDNRN